MIKTFPSVMALLTAAADVHGLDSDDPFHAVACVAQRLQAPAWVEVQASNLLTAALDTADGVEALLYAAEAAGARRLSRCW